MLFSVAICTYNPRPEYLARVLAALRAQTMPLSQWELLLIDNASTTATARETGLAWHPAARHVLEPTLGQAHARLRAIKEATGEILVFVDDDNVLAPDYLEHTAAIAATHSWLGAWGAGRIVGDFEEPPPEWTQPFHGLLAISEIARDSWANSLGSSNTPYGAGLCIRLPLAQAHAQRLEANPQGFAFGRKGHQAFVSHEDIHIASVAIDLGLGVGRFKRLSFTHLIPPSRLTVEYLERLVEGSYFAETLFYHRLGQPLPIAPDSFFQRLALWRYERTLDPRARRVRAAQRRGRARAYEEIARLPAAAPIAQPPAA
jgi:glycosyltransferase involved in cell wall biosynthesis